jgi:hypothetical protein
MKAKRWTVTVRDCWEKYPGYIQEAFAVVQATGVDNETIDNYPFARHLLRINDHPDYLAPVLRYRICYEPTLNECPAYLEIVYAGGGFRQDISIKGLGSTYFNRKELTPLLEARELWYGLYDPENIEIRFGNAHLSEETRARFVEFLRAAELLGSDSKNNKTFSVVKLCNKLEGRRGDKSRNVYYKLLDAMRAETGSEQFVEAKAREIKEAFEQVKQKVSSLPIVNNTSEGIPEEILLERANQMAQ